MAVTTEPRAIPAWAAGPPYRFLTANEAAVVIAATARLIPGPTDDILEVGSPGAREANVVGYIDALLSAFDYDPPLLYAGGPFSGRRGGTTNDFARFLPLTDLQDRWWRDRIAELQSSYRRGIRALDAASPGGSFATASAMQQDQVLATDASGFRDLLFDHAIEGWLANPEYGGNRQQVGWSAVHFPGDVCPAGYTDEEVTQGDGIDPIDPTGIVSLLVDEVRGVTGA
jgi:hypothetical protein